MSPIVMKKQTILADARRETRRGAVERARPRHLALVRVGGGSGGDSTGPAGDSTTLHASTDATLDVTAATSPAWWPAGFAWPPSSTPPAGWTGAKWPPATAADLIAGMPAGSDLRHDISEALPPPPPPKPDWWPTSLTWPAATTSPPGWNAAMKWPPTSAAELSAGMTASITSPPSPPPAAPSQGMTPGQRDAIATGAGALAGGVVAKIALGAGSAAFGPIALGALIGAALGHVFYAMATGNPVTAVATKGCGCGGDAGVGAIAVPRRRPPPASVDQTWNVLWGEDPAMARPTVKPAPTRPVPYNSPGRRRRNETIMEGGAIPGQTFHEGLSTPSWGRGF